MIPAGFYHFARMATLFTFGVSFLNIFLFYVEDAFNFPMLNPFFTGQDYASPLSFVWTSFAALLVFEFLEKKLILKGSEPKTTEIRQRWDGRVVAVCLILGVAICAAVLYRYLSGQTVKQTLYQTGVTLGVLSVGAIYSYVNLLRYQSKISHKFWGFVVFLMLVGGTGLVSYIALTMAPPHEIALLRKDIESLKRMNALLTPIQKYVETKGNLPEGTEALKSVAGVGVVVDGHGKTFEYSKLSADKLKLCTEFQSAKSDQLRRIGGALRYSAQRHYIQKGRFCANYGLHKKSNGKFEIKMMTHHHGDDHHEHDHTH